MEVESGGREDRRNQYNQGKNNTVLTIYWKEGRSSGLKITVSIRDQEFFSLPASSHRNHRISLKEGDKGMVLLKLIAVSLKVEARLLLCGAKGV